MRDFDDIPMAVRDGNPRRRDRFSVQQRWLWVMGVAVALTGVVLGAMVRLGLERRVTQSSTNAASQSVAANQGQGSASGGMSPSAAPTPADNLLGHLKYPEAPLDNLVTITGSPVKMRQTAADAFMQMQDAAHADGIQLVALSGFRSIEDQKQLFFGVKAIRNQTAAQRATVSAPPGYSEHHTGYAVDVGDAGNPGTNLSETFEATAAHQWLAKNAARFSFELSFPKGNSQGVNYEPWHWRFVGDQESLEMFYKAHQLGESASPEATPGANSEASPGTTSQSDSPQGSPQGTP
jgi:zinc D-Ala-D-Ala carboxypeptidase